MLTLRGAIVPADVPGLCARVENALRESEANLVVCDVAEVTDPDCATVDALARMQLTARRLGRRAPVAWRCRTSCTTLLALAGLCDVVGLCGGYAVEPRGQAEQREEPLGVEEERDPADAAVADLEDLQRPRLVGRRPGRACTGPNAGSRSPSTGRGASPGSRCPARGTT